jgi:TonB-dependent Receptor Plug Domain
LIQDTLHLVVKATNQRGKTLESMVVVDDTWPVMPPRGWPILPKKMSPTVLRKRYIEALQETISTDTSGITLGEVVVKEQRKINFDTDSDGNLLWKIYAEPDGFILVNDFIQKTTGDIMTLIRGRIPAIRISGQGTLTDPYTYTTRGPVSLTSGGGSGNSSAYEDTPGKGGPLFLINGVPVSAPRVQGDYVTTIPLREVDRIDYLTNQSAIYGLNGTYGVIAIYLKKARSMDNASKDVSVIEVVGYGK